MSDAVLNIEVQAEVEQAVRAMGEINGSFEGMKRANEDAAGALGVFGVSLTAFNDPLTMVAEGLKNSMETALSWGETVQNLATESGQTAQQASTMATVFGDFGVQTDSLNRIVKTFTKEGLQFNLATIEQLSEKYNAIEDPVKRNAFAYKEFGMSAQNLNEILSAGPAKLQELADAAQNSGKVIDQNMVTSMENARIKAQQLNDKIDGLKIAIGAPMVNTLVAAGDAGGKLAQTYDELGIAILAHTGIITWDEAASRAAAVAQGDLAAGIRGATVETVAVSDASDRLTASQNYLSPAIDAVTTVTKIDTEANKAQLDYMLKNGDAIGKNIDAYFKLQTAEQAKADQMALTAGLQGTVTQGAITYDKVIDGNADKIAKLTAELTTLTAANGQVATATLNNKYSVDQLDLANNKVQIGSEKMQIAEEKLAQAHQGAKESADAYQTRLESLRVAVQSAGDTWQSAQISVDKMNSTTNASTGGIIDNTAAIAKDQTALNALTDQNTAAAAAMLKANEQLVFQAATAGLSADAAATVANKMGLMDDATYAMVRRAEALNVAEKAGTITTDQLGTSADALAKEFTAASTPVAYLGLTVDGLGGQAKHAQDSVDGLGASINALHDKNVNITTNIITNTTSNSSGHGGVDASGNYVYAGGADFIVPPGFPNDSFPMRVQSGEHVQVTPAGQEDKSGKSGNTTNFNVTYYGAATDQRTLVQDLSLFTRMRQST
jgi:hypothetical protein